MKALISRLRRIDHLILYRRAGRPAECAEKIGISERSLYDHLRLMRELGAPIYYSRQAGTYLYKVEGSFSIGFFRHLNDEPLDLHNESLRLPHESLETNLQTEAQ